MNRAWTGVLAAMILLGVGGCADRSFVDQIVVENPTDFTTTVDVTGEQSSGWLSLTTAAAGSENTVEDVIDQGDTWVFRFSYSGYRHEVEVARAELVEADWRVEVPDSFATALRDRGVLPPP